MAFIGWVLGWRMVKFAACEVFEKAWDWWAIYTSSAL